MGISLWLAVCTFLSISFFFSLQVLFLHGAHRTNIPPTQSLSIGGRDSQKPARMADVWLPSFSPSPTSAHHQKTRTRQDAARNSRVEECLIGHRLGPRFEPDLERAPNSGRCNVNLQQDAAYKIRVVKSYYPGRE
ncbi:hypothetical protein V8F06_011502 [Rhypophila decipiens]